MHVPGYFTRFAREQAAQVSVSQIAAGGAKRACSGQERSVTHCAEMLLEDV